MQSVAYFVSAHCAAAALYKGVPVVGARSLQVWCWANLGRMEF